MNARKVKSTAPVPATASGETVPAIDLAARREDLVERLARRRAELARARELEADRLIDGADVDNAAAVARAAAEEVSRLETAIALVDARIARANDRAELVARADRMRRDIDGYMKAAAALSSSIPHAIDQLVNAMTELADDDAHVDFHLRRRAHADEIVEHVRREFDARCAGRVTPFRAALAEAAARYARKSDDLARDLPLTEN